MKWLSKLYLKITGWNYKLGFEEPHYKNCVMICAPHTSNWDFPLALSIMDQLGARSRYAVKKEAFVFPLGPIMKKLGCIPIDRRPKTDRDKKVSTVDAIASLFDQYDELCLLIAAEGSRSLREEWKTGFYYIALKANVPICLGYLDYDNKVGGIGKVIHPCGDIDKDMAEIMNFFAQFKGKFPQKFSLDRRFISSDSSEEDT